MKTVALVGTFDTKGTEFLYVKNLFRKMKLGVFTIHAGVFAPMFIPDIGNDEVAEAAGYSIAELVEKKDRALAMEVMAKGIQILIPELYRQKKFDAIMSFGGSGGTSLAAPAMQKLPIGVPKLIVSTMASGDVSNYVGLSDIIMMPSIVDISGINAISEKIFSNAAMAMAGMLQFASEVAADAREKKKTVAAMMFGVTTPCVETARKYLEERGYEVIVFHATGIGGRTMEMLAASDYFDGILDITTTEWCDEVVGGILSAGEHRNEAAALHGIPQVVSVGAMDMVNYGEIRTVPEECKGRNLYKHNAMITLMRTNEEENRQIAGKLAEKLNMARERTALFLPLRGVSMLDAPMQPFYGPQEDAVLFQTLKEKITNKEVEIVEVDAHINDEKFAVAAAEKLISYMEERM